MTQEAISFVFPPSRFVWGSLYERQTEGYQGKKYDPGKEPIQFGIAVRKDDPNVNDTLGKLYQQAMAGYANNPAIQQRIQQEWQAGFPGQFFHFKVKDGDRPNDKGQFNENTRGCWVFSMGTLFDVRTCNWDNAQIDPKEIEKGYYVDVHTSVKVNDMTDSTAGLYLNPNIVRLLGYGERIIGGVSIEEAFGNAPAPTNLPPGASRTPVASGGMPGLPDPQQPPQPGQMPQQPPNPTGMPAGGAPNAAPPPPNPAPMTQAAPGAYPSNPQQPPQPGQMPQQPPQHQAGAPAPLPGAPNAAPPNPNPAGNQMPGSPTASPSNFPGVQPHTGFVQNPGGVPPMPGQGQQ